jgi:hypothetical protein
MPDECRAIAALGSVQEGGGGGDAEEEERARGEERGKRHSRLSLSLRKPPRRASPRSGKAVGLDRSAPSRRKWGPRARARRCVPGWGKDGSKRGRWGDVFSLSFDRTRARACVARRACAQCVSGKVVGKGVGRRSVTLSMVLCVRERALSGAAFVVPLDAASSSPPTPLPDACDEARDDAS